MKLWEWIIVIICGVILAVIVGEVVKDKTGDYVNCITYPDNPEMGQFC